MIDFIRNHPAAYISSLDSLVIADLHLGIEHDMERKGVIVEPPDRKMLHELSILLDETGAKNIFILGDVKHAINPNHNEIEKVRNFFNEIKKRANIFIIKGNHDGSLEKFLDVKIYGSRGIRRGDFYFNHGHTWPDKRLSGSKYLLMGHLHPEVKIIIPGEEKKFHRCWLIGTPGRKFKKYYDFDGEIVILPAFNPFVGMSIREYAPGPLFRNGLVSMGNMEVYLLDSTDIGKFSHIAVKR